MQTRKALQPYLDELLRTIKTSCNAATYDKFKAVCAPVRNGKPQLPNIDTLKSLRSDLPDENLQAHLDVITNACERTVLDLVALTAVRLLPTIDKLIAQSSAQTNLNTVRSRLEVIVVTAQSAVRRNTVLAYDVTLLRTEINRAMRAGLRLDTIELKLFETTPNHIAKLLNTILPPNQRI